MAGRMMVSWGGVKKPAPCTAEEFDLIYRLWTGPWNRKILPASHGLRAVTYNKQQTVELIALCRRLDRGEALIEG